MCNDDKLLQVLFFPHVSEKSSCMMKNNNVIVFNVDKKSSKLDIKNAVSKLFSVDVRDIRTLIVKGKVKKNGKNASKRSDWKKAYVTLADGQTVDFTSEIQKSVS